MISLDSLLITGAVVHNELKELKLIINLNLHNAYFRKMFSLSDAHGTEQQHY